MDALTPQEKDGMFEIVYPPGDGQTGRRYKGFINSSQLPNGKGSMEWDNGDHFDGIFVDGKKCYGTLTKQDGMQYIGDFTDDIPKGKGTIQKPHSYKYTGTHTEYNFENGEYTFPTKHHNEEDEFGMGGERHDGEWIDNVPGP